jgi:putative transcriptional regulator
VIRTVRARLRNRLGPLLAMRDWSEADLARRTGLTRAHVNRLKNGRVRPSLRDGLLISRALGVSVETIFAAPDPGGPAER